jgi:hypothetical protein
VQPTSRVESIHFRDALARRFGGSYRWWLSAGLGFIMPSLELGSMRGHPASTAAA